MCSILWEMCSLTFPLHRYSSIIIMRHTNASIFFVIKQFKTFRNMKTAFELKFPLNMGLHHRSTFQQMFQVLFIVYDEPKIRLTDWLTVGVAMKKNWIELISVFQYTKSTSKTFSMENAHEYFRIRYDNVNEENWVAIFGLVNTKLNQ